MNRRVRVVVAVVVSLGLVGPAVVRNGTASAVPSGPVPSSPVCGVADLATISPPVQPAPSAPAHVVARGFAVSALVAGNSRLHALDAEARTVRSFGLDGADLGAFTVAWRIRAPALVVDPAGNFYLGRYPSTVVKLSPSGSELWSRDVGGEIVSLYGVSTGAGFRVGVVKMGEPGSTQLDGSGGAAGASPITGTAFSTAPGGDLVATDGAYVRRYDPAGNQKVVFGDAHVGEPRAPAGGKYHFYQQGGAAVGADGTFFVADATRGIHLAAPEGYYRGLAPDATLGALTERAWVVLMGDRLYFSAGGRFNRGQTISWASVADVTALATAPRTPEPVLGFGAGLTTGATGQYFPPGRTPSVTARFDPWWASLAPGLSLRYTVRERRQILAGEAVRTSTVPLPTTAAGLAAVPLPVPPGHPGAYEVDARIVRSGDGAVVGSTCLRYTVGGAGARLDFATLPAGSGSGGPTPPRAVALADQLGVGGIRLGVEWPKLLPNRDGPLDFSAYEADFAAAAREAAARGVTWWVQVGVGHPVERALVADGTWERRVGELVAHFRGVVPAWEAWNEPNNNFGPAPDYVSKVLAPFSRAVRSNDPAAKVVGASVLDMDMAYFDAIGVAGGYPMMDVVGIHPYPGHNRAFEEQGLMPSIEALRPLLARYGAASKEIWITELAWWADGPGSYYAQADKVARSMLLARAAGLDQYSYMLPEASYGDYGLSYSLIQGESEPDYVKPAALASMTAAAQTDQRPFTGMRTTGIPYAYAAGFGTRLGGADTVVAAWTDDLDVAAALSADGPATVTVTDVMGATTTIPLAAGEAAPLSLSGSPVYLSAPAGTELRIDAAEAFGPNVAAAAAGAAATASSANPANPPRQAIDGVADAMVRGDLIGLPAWASAPGDDAPSLTVRLARPTVLDRVLVATHSNGSIVPGLRSYDVSVERGGVWEPVAEVRDQLFRRMRILSFAPREVTAIRVDVRLVNYSGYVGGLTPWFWPGDAASRSDPNGVWYGPAVIYELEAYEPRPGAFPSPPTTTTTAPTTTVPPTTTTTAPTTTVPPTGAPPAPTGLVAPAVSSNQINMRWDASPGADRYQVERSTDNSTWVVRGSTTETNWADLPLAPATTYYYRVRATNGSGHSTPSNTASATTRAP